MDGKTEKALLEAIEIATTAAQLASAVSLHLHQLKAIPPQASEHYAKLNEHLGRLYEQYGDDQIASDFGATANLLRGGASLRGKG